MAQHLINRKLQKLIDMAEWQFITVCHEGLLSEPHAGCMFDNVYYGEGLILAAYFSRNPDAPPLF